MNNRLHELILKACEAVIHIPTKEDIDSVAIGRHELSPFGQWKKVTEIYARGKDEAGRSYVCFYVEMSETGSISQSMKEGELIRTLPLCNKLNSAECNELEKLFQNVTKLPQLDSMILS